MNKYKDKIFGEEWSSWVDPEVPEYFNPTTVVLDKHLETNEASSIALIVDDESYTYEQFLHQVRQRILMV